MAEDYAEVAGPALNATQVKDTSSRVATLKDENVRAAIASFVQLVKDNPTHDVTLHYFTTSMLGTEHLTSDRIRGEAGLQYWRRAAAKADVKPIRKVLKGSDFPKAVRDFVNDRDDEALRHDLLQRIHWDCGRPNIDVLRQELEEHLIVLGRDKYGLSSDESLGLADVLICQVLMRSIQKQPAQRVLTRAALYDTVDRARGVYVRRSDAMSMEGFATTMAQGGAGAASSLQLTIAEPGWIVRSEALSASTGMIRRENVELKILHALRDEGACVVFGASGLGKSSLVQRVAMALGGAFVIADLRDVSVEDARARLDELFRRSADFARKTVVLEDLNHLDDPRISRSLVKLVEALRRRDCTMVVTCYRVPLTRSIHGLNLSAACIVECPYFTADETTELVGLHGGDAKVWGAVAHAVGAFGHPQLVFAFVVGMRARGWPREELVDVVGKGFSSGDIDAELEVARRTLVGTLGEDPRSLLYRLSLAIGRFDRALAFVIARVAPEIMRSGEHLDGLIGPWIETVAAGSYRVSPLAARSGQAMIPADERLAIHSAIAGHHLSGHVISGDNVDVILAHALAGKNSTVLFKVSCAIIMAQRAILARLGSSVPALLVFGFDRPIFAENLAVSALLRLAQFKLIGESNRGDNIASCARALFTEMKVIPRKPTEGGFQAVAYSTVLSTMGIANHLDDWLVRLEEFRRLSGESEYLQSLADRFEQGSQNHVDMFGTLFAIGAQGISSVARLEQIIDELSALTPERRDQFLSVLAIESADFSTFIKAPWVADRPANPAQALVHAERYARMAARTKSWSIQSITVQCWISRAVMFDEYADERDEALSVLDSAEQILGEDIALTRARAAIYFRAKDYVTALRLSKKVADQIGLNDPVERAFALREAAISAANVDDWNLARSWFLEAKTAADQCSIPDMSVMAVGLVADASVAAAYSGHLADALRGLAQAMKALPSIAPDSSLRAAFCHRLVRHTVLWMLSHVGKRGILIEGTPPFMTPGVCSNPEPSERILSSQLWSLDGSWYVLAEAEVLSGQDVGITASLPDQLTAGSIWTMEIGLRGALIQKAIEHSNLRPFVAHLWRFVEAMATAATHKHLIGTPMKGQDFPRGDIPSLARDVATPGVTSTLIDAVFSYAICAVCNGLDPNVENIVSALQAELGGPFPGMDELILPSDRDRPHPTGGMKEGLLRGFRLFKSGGAPLPPKHYVMLAIWFYDWAEPSNFKPQLIPAIARWMRRVWTRIVESETFKLSMPRVTVPPIERALAVEQDDTAFLAVLILAAAPAAQRSLPADMVEKFKALCWRPDPASVGER
ncbi:hypothetical protein GCM10007863_30810 [Dyella mobilis]|nr:hypothetical protein GCM10007863_30810 [Dyella mobilis]